LYVVGGEFNKKSSSNISVTRYAELGEKNALNQDVGYEKNALEPLLLILPSGMWGMKRQTECGNHFYFGESRI